MSDGYGSEPRDPRHCSVVNAECERPAGFAAGGGVYESTREDMKGPACRCYACGNDVCRKCSHVVSRRVTATRYGKPARATCRVRVCDDCLENDDTTPEPRP